ncbi:hypothetical protein [Synechocystis sp. LKSZ1]|uniref:hypothetical protein n=1 Tax=Synechocystis sp. LKSZ1 TaxID=3144951 RepID=UPI00336C21F5
MLFTIGLIVLALAALLLVFELRTSYVTHGGEIGQVPVLSAVIQVPLLVMVGLWLITKAKPALAFPGWIYPLLGVALALIIGWLIIKIGDLGRRRERLK